MTDPTAPKIALHGLTKSFGVKQVLRGLDLEVSRAESMVIIGGSGSGKSVLLKCLLGLMPVDAGTIQIDGVTAGVMGAAARARLMTKFGMLFQGAALFDSLPVWENVAFGLIQGRDMARPQAREIAHEKLAQVGLTSEIGSLYPAELSGGMQKRVGLARAIAGDPEIILFDEPTTGLDPIMADVINDLIVKCVAELGASAVSITHDIASARKIANRVAMLHEGRIIWQGEIDNIDVSDNPYVDQFIHGRAEGPIAMTIAQH